MGDSGDFEMQVQTFSEEGSDGLDFSGFLSSCERFKTELSQHSEGKQGRGLRGLILENYLEMVELNRAMNAPANQNE